MIRPGLRGRIAASLVLTAAVALGVAALGLLTPLARKLRQQQVRDLVSAAVQSRSDFGELDPGHARGFELRLSRRVRRLATATGARIAVLDPNGQVLVNTDPDAPDGFRDFAAALKTDRAVRRIVNGRSLPQARVAVRVSIEGRHYVLALRKPLSEQRAAVVQVQRAFGTAALAALAVALLVAGFFAATVGRRVRKLRDAVIRFRPGHGSVEMPSDDAHDEVGDLSRAFSDLAQRLQREEEVRRAFVATASHELRTPLMTLQGRLELLGDELARPSPDLADGRRQLSEAREQAERLSRLASDLLDLSRLDAEVPLRREEIDLADLVRAVAAEFDSRGRDVVTELEPAHVLADPSASARVVRVLLDNALRYSQPATAVALSTTTENGSALVSVTDRGMVIAEADRERIFERFARGSDANAPGGFGLGLAIAHELTERMGGSLELLRSDESGTVFRLALPATAPALPNRIPTAASRS